MYTGRDDRMWPYLPQEIFFCLFFFSHKIGGVVEELYHDRVVKRLRACT